MYDPRVATFELHLDAGDAVNAPERGLYVLDAAVAGHAANPQGGNHEATVA